MIPIHRKKEWAHQVGETTGLRHSDRLVQGTVDCIGGYLKQNSADLGFGQIGCTASAERTLGITGSCFGHPLAVGAVENSTSSGTTSSCSLKDLGQLQFAHSLKNVYMTRPVEESEAMRKWKEIKQNGFLSHPHGGVPMPEPQHGKKSKRKAKRNDQKRKIEMVKEEQDNRKMETPKGEQDRRKIETAKGGQDNRKMEALSGEQENMSKNAPSSGLLSRISTGIIRRVKNYKEVHAILEDMVRVEKQDSRILNEFVGREGSEGKEIIYTTNYQSQHFQYLNGTSFPPCSDQKQKEVISENSEAYPEHGDGSHELGSAEESFGHEAVIASECFSGHDKKVPLIITSSDVSVKACDGDSSGKLKSGFSKSNKGHSQ